LADVRPDDSSPAAQAREASCRGRRTTIVEAHAVEEAAVGGEAEQSRRRITGLRDRGDRADLDVSEPERPQPADAYGVLVEARRDAERGGERHTQGVDTERG